MNQTSRKVWEKDEWTDERNKRLSVAKKIKHEWDKMMREVHWFKMSFRREAFVGYGREMKNMIGLKLIERWEMMFFEFKKREPRARLTKIRENSCAMKRDEQPPRDHERYAVEGWVDRTRNRPNHLRRWLVRDWGWPSMDLRVRDDDEESEKA